MSDLYALSKIRENFEKDNFLFCGRAGNIGNTWRDASYVFGFSVEQCCPHGYEIKNVGTLHNIKIVHDLNEAIKNKDIICTDSIPASVLSDFENFQITKDILEKANIGAVLNPCPPFYRGEEVSQDAISSDYFVGYQFKKWLLTVQQAIMIFIQK